MRTETNWTSEMGVISHLCMSLEPRTHEMCGYREAANKRCSW